MKDSLTWSGIYRKHRREWNLLFLLVFVIVAFGFTVFVISLDKPISEYVPPEIVKMTELLGKGVGWLFLPLGILASFFFLLVVLFGMAGVISRIVKWSIGKRKVYDKSGAWISAIVTAVILLACKLSGVRSVGDGITQSVLTLIGVAFWLITDLMLVNRDAKLLADAPSKIEQENTLKQVLPILLCVVFLASCSVKQPVAPSEPTPTPESSLMKAMREEQDATTDDTLENRMAVREAVTGYFVKFFPDWKIEGISLSEGYSGAAMYRAGVDLSSGEKRQTVVLRVWLFVKEDGGSYWKAEPMDQSE